MELIMRNEKSERKQIEIQESLERAKLEEELRKKRILDKKAEVEQRQKELEIIKNKGLIEKKREQELLAESRQETRVKMEKIEITRKNNILTKRKENEIVRQQFLHQKELVLQDQKVQINIKRQDRMETVERINKM